MNIQEAFAKHINNEYPPKYVYFLDTSGNLQYIETVKINSLEDSYTYFAHTSELPAYSEEWSRAGHLPMLKLKEFE